MRAFVATAAVLAAASLWAPGLACAGEKKPARTENAAAFFVMAQLGRGDTTATYMAPGGEAGLVRKPAVVSNVTGDDCHMAFTLDGRINEVLDWTRVSELIAPVDDQNLFMPTTLYQDTANTVILRAMVRNSLGETLSEQRIAFESYPLAKRVYAAMKILQKQCGRPSAF